MSKVRHVEYHPDELISAVAGEMEMAELGVYWMICSLIYSRGKAIPDDPAWLARKFKDTHLRSLTAVLNRLISSGRVTRNSGELMVNRCREELEKSAKRISTNRGNGGKGGRPPKENNEIEEPTGYSENNPPLTTNLKPVTNNQEEDRTSPDHATEMFSIWRDVFKDVWPKTTTCDGRRAKRLNARLKDTFGGDTSRWRAYCAQVYETGFLIGENDRGWKATIDWILEPAHMTEILEEKYSGRRAKTASTNGHSPPSDDYGHDAELSQWRARMKGADKLWLDNYGPRPGQPGCRVPLQILKEFEMGTGT